MYMTGRNGRSPWERQGIFAFCTCQWNRIEYYWLTFKVRNVSSLVSSSWSFLPFRMFHWVVSRCREWKPQPHWHKSLKTRITSIYFHFLCSSYVCPDVSHFCTDWKRVTGSEQWSCSILPHNHARIRRWFTWIKLGLDSSGTAKLNHESLRSL
jgi:hypothetical protein